MPTNRAAMPELKPDRRSDSGRSPGGGNGAHPVALDPWDRSHLLRRGSKYPFLTVEEEEGIRIRRERRRVSASFSAIPPLARNAPR